MSAPVLDTHAWVWWMTRDPRLGVPALNALDAMPADGRPHLADISLWEVAMLVERKRLALSLPLGEWLALAAHPRTVNVVPVSPAIAAEVANLPAAFQRDPADRLIVATCRVLKATIATHDRLITRSRLVKRWAP
jgi:PIN domain nuclease of toxin-antitoxin system